MKIYRISQSSNNRMSYNGIVYHISDKAFDTVGGNSGLGMHVAVDIDGAVMFASEWYSKGETPYVYTFNYKADNIVKLSDIGIFNSPANLFESLLSYGHIDQGQFVGLSKMMGAPEDIKDAPIDAWDEVARFNDFNEPYESMDEDIKEEYSKEVFDYLMKEGLDYTDWNSARDYLMKECGIDGIFYEGTSDVTGTCFVVFHPSQLKLISMDKYLSEEDIKALSGKNKDHITAEFLNRLGNYPKELYRDHVEYLDFVNNIFENILDGKINYSEIPESLKDKNFMSLISDFYEVELTHTPAGRGFYDNRFIEKIPEEIMDYNGDLLSIIEDGEPFYKEPV